MEWYHRYHQLSEPFYQEYVEQIHAKIKFTFFAELLFFVGDLPVQYK